MNEFKKPEDFKMNIDIEPDGQFIIPFGLEEEEEKIVRELPEKLTKEFIIKNKLEEFGGFANEKERSFVARENDVIGDDIKNFYRIWGKIYYKEPDNTLMPVKEWYKKDTEERRERGDDAYMRGQY